MDILSCEQLLSIEKYLTMNFKESSTVQSLFANQVNKSSDKLAVIVGEQTITYQELNAKSDNFALYLKEKYNVKIHNVIAIHIENSVSLIIALLATLKLRANYLPLDITYPEDRKSYMVSNANVKLILCSNEERLYVKNTHTAIVNDELFQSNNEIYSELTYLPQDPLYILYTSGSTGKPKGVTLKQTGVINMLKWYCLDFNVGKFDLNLVFSSFAYDLTQKNILSSLISGQTLVLTQDKEYRPDRIVSLIIKHKVTIINSTPSAFYPLLDFIDDISQLSSLRWIFLGGEKINCQRLQIIGKLYPKTKVVNTYGPTECSDVACSYTLTEEDIIRCCDVPLGYPIKNVGVLVLDKDLKLITGEQVGEVYLFGNCLGDGYINQPELTKEKFLNNLPKHLTEMDINRLYRVGDIGYWDKLGRLNFMGRIDDQIKLRGHRIELLEIDVALENIDETIKQAVTVLVEKQNRLVLVSFCLVSKEINSSEIRKHLNEFLPTHMLPNLIVPIGKYPLTPNAKIDKNALKKLAGELI